MQGVCSNLLADVENEVVAAFAMFAKYPVVVYNFWGKEAQIICPPSMMYHLEALPLHLRSSVHGVRTTPFVLWNDGGHYQAVVPLSRFRASATALNSFRYKTSNVVDKEDLELIVEEVD